MTVILCIVIVLLVIALAVQHKRNSDKLADAWAEHIKDLTQATLDYEALDQGMTEVTDAYQTDSLQYEESLEKAFEKYQDVSRLLELSLDDNLISKARVAFLEQELDASRQAALDFQIISVTHDAVCLPTLEK